MPIHPPEKNSIILLDNSEIANVSGGMEGIQLLLGTTVFIFGATLAILGTLYCVETFRTSNVMKRKNGELKLFRCLAIGFMVTGSIASALGISAFFPKNIFTSED